MNILPLSARLREKAEEGQWVELEHSGRKYRCRLLAGPRNRNIRMRLVAEIGDGTAAGAGCASQSDARSGLLPGFDRRDVYVVRVTYPLHVSRRSVLETVRRNLDWVEKQIQRQLRLPAGVGRQALVTGARVFFRGRRLTLYLLPLMRKRPAVVLTDDKFICQTRCTHPTEIKRLLERWYRRKAEEMIGERLLALAPTVTRKSYRVAIRTQKSRWGSCSENRTLSLNWKLVMMPDFVMNYVLIHELAHLEEMNHSQRFWRLVRRNCPYCESAQKWLRKHGPELEW